VRYDQQQQRTCVFGDHARTNTGWDPVEWACRVVAAGAGEILLTDADRDGSGRGLNVEVGRAIADAVDSGRGLNVEVGRAIADAVDVPVILSGGCGLARHFVEGFQAGRAEGVAAGTFFCFRDQNPMQARAHVRSSGIPIRLETLD
jgi:cyclase